MSIKGAQESCIRCCESGETSEIVAGSVEKQRTELSISSRGLVVVIASERGAGVGVAELKVEVVPIHAGERTHAKIGGPAYDTKLIFLKIV
jgi:hypothetical protein